ncbi:MAG: Murein DD-endopeptidase MepM [Alphaproteobacteria bacterium MarineAlpha2_Bin1]|nr:MAG: Murein DD-endopeptidase MepM [Alphaproteobacteria bacterium MarineAlpha2_Bin1]|tara:strand:+ start:1144 stop:2595 length:1452 start_codon:yes stop_codon:yes gene_type:complete
MKLLKDNFFRFISRGLSSKSIFPIKMHTKTSPIFSFSNLLKINKYFYLIFPDREIYLRTNGRVKFVTLPSWAQLIFLLVFISLFCWITFTSTQYILHSEIVSAKNDKIKELKLSYSKLDDKYNNSRKAFIKITLELESKHKQLVYLVAQKNKLELDLKKITKDLAIFKQKHLDQKNKNITVKSKIEKEKLALSNQIINLKNVMDKERDYSKKLIKQLESSQEDAKIISRKKEEYKNSAENLANQIIELSENIERLRYDQQYFADKIMDRTNDDLFALESIIKMTGLNLEKIISKNAKELGGPLLPLDWQLEDHGGEPDQEAKNFQKTVLLMEEKLIKWQSIHMLMRRIPITSPVKSYYISSPYGRRKDPFTKKWSFHSGVDLGGTKGQYVYTPAPGKVTSVSKTGPYGKMIEIDHGFNLRTRYGHLKKILVKRGEIVEFKERIGQVGNTGRSTGSHLHYEVWYGNKVLDPNKFLKAGKHVFKN